MSCIIIHHPLFSVLSIVWSKNLVHFFWPLSHCFCLSGKPKAVRLQALKNTVTSPFSFSKQESSCSSLSKPENSTPTKSITPVFNTTTTTTLHPAPPPATPVVRSRRTQQEVLKPVVFVLPPVHFPNFFPPQHSRPGFSPSFNYNKWRTSAQTVPLSRSGGGPSKDAMVKSRPLFWAYKKQHEYDRRIIFCAKCLLK